MCYEKIGGQCELEYNRYFCRAYISGNDTKPRISLLLRPNFCTCTPYAFDMAFP
jgi:hypothetical protein